MPNQTLSVTLTELLAEAQTLVNLKAEFGRLPNSPVKTGALKAIEDWFNATCEHTPEINFHTKRRSPEMHSGAVDENSSKEMGFLSFLAHGSARADSGSLDEDDIPF